MTNADIYGPIYGQSEVCDRILHSLPEWFGIESSIQNYTHEVGDMPTFIVVAGYETVGFLSVKLHNSYSAELYVMGILAPWQRQGLGKAMLEKAETWMREQGIEYLQVKTLADSHPDVYYARTRAFYFNVGFRPLEVMDAIWGPDNPCAIMVKKIDQRYE